MFTSAEQWNELANEFLSVKDQSIYATCYVGDRWVFRTASREEIVIPKCQRLVRKAGHLAGAPTSAPATDWWCDLLCKDVKDTTNPYWDELGQIHKLCEASAEYCRELATNVAELEDIVKSNSHFALRADRYMNSEASEKDIRVWFKDVISEMEKSKEVVNGTWKDAHSVGQSPWLINFFPVAPHHRR